MNTESLGQILAGKRKSLKYKQADVVRMLKERFGIESSVHAISHWEKDASMPSAKQFLALCEIYQIGNKPVRMCINCGGCRRNGGKGCVFNDDPCNEIAQKMAESDALIVGTPVYYGQPNGGILAVMQRLFFASGRLVQNKPAAAVAVCRRGGATATLQTMNMMFEMMNMPVVTSQYWNIAYGAGKGEAKMDKEGMQTMRTLGNNMAWLLQRIGDGPAPERDERPEFMNFIR